VALFGLVGVSAAEALLLSASSRVLIAISALPWSLHYLFKRHHSLTLSVEPSFTSAQETLKT
jgi:hypothetical protein